MRSSNYPYRPGFHGRFVTGIPVLLKYSFLLVSLALAAGARAQTSQPPPVTPFSGIPRPAAPEGLNEILDKFDGYRSKALTEKLFVHTDKTFYLAGEVCWFKIYDVDGSFHRPLDLSKVAYTEILDKDNKFVLQGKIALQGAEGMGSFYLPLTLSSGHYKLRAYTSWMKNFGADYFFEEPLTILNTLRSLPDPASVPGGANTSPAWHISFFPEGGNLVKGVPTRIAFQVTDPYGKGTDCTGVIIDEQTDTLAFFRPLRSGIGNFLFTPPVNHTCKAVIRMPGGQIIMQELPAAYDRGLVMNIGEGNNDQLTVTVRSRGGASSGDLYLLAQTRQLVKVTRHGILQSDSAVFIIDKSSLADGITQFTLFNDARQPVCERLYFKRPGRQLLIGAHTDQEQYGTRKHVRLSISSEGPASLSMSVYRLDSLQSLPGTDIYNYLWLSSDLKGPVESPDTYFSARGPEADQALDNLMLSHGWRRFRWEDILQGGDPVLPYQPEYIGQLITGRLTDMKTGIPLRNRIASLSVPGTQFRFQPAATDSAGRLFFDIKDFYGPGGFVIHSGQESDSPCKVEIFSPFSELFSSRNLSPSLPSAVLQDSLHNIFSPVLADHSVGMQVQNIYSGDSLQRFRAPSLRDTLHFFGQPANSYLLDNYTRFTTMEEVLREYVREVNINHYHKRLHVEIFDDPLRLFFQGNNALVLLDGIPVPDDRIFSYDPLKVRELQIVPRLYFIGPAVYSGVASFTTYKGDYDGYELDPRSLLIDYDGLQLRREFYSPVYETGTQQASRQPDFRNLLAWSPDLHTDKEGKKETGFYTSDLPGTYVAVIQGLTMDGYAGVKYVFFEVK